MKFGIFLFSTLFYISSFASSACDSIPNSTSVFDTVTEQFKGCKLTSVDSKSIYADLGLKSGDIIQPNPTSSAKLTKLSFAEEKSNVRDLNSIIAKATPEETKDLNKLMGQISLIPAKHAASQNGATVFKVIKIEKGSVYDREGIKAGDLVSQ